VINGRKTFITNAAKAGFITLAVKTDPEKGYQGISLIIFPTDTEGFAVTRKLDKLGQRGTDTCEFVMEDCRVPAWCLLGEENRGFYYIMQNFQGERLVAAVSTTSSMQIILEDAMEYSRQRTTFGKPLCKHQVIRHYLVDMATEIEAARLLTYHYCDLFNRRVDCVKEVSMAKLFVGEMAQRVVYKGLQIHGGYGYMEEYPVARSYRDTRLITIGGGSSEIMKEIIGRLMGL
jgi:citronellyl-CoA dehydrogenase